MRNGVEQVVAAVPERPCAGGKQARNRPRVEAGRIAVMPAVHRKGDGMLDTARCTRGDPYRTVGPGQHFAPPHHVQFGFDAFPRNPVRDPVTASARLERQHETRTCRAATTRLRPQAELAMETEYLRGTPFGEMKRRVPDQRPIAKHPDTVAARRARKHLRDLRGAFFRTHEYNPRAERRPGGGMQ